MVDELIESINVTVQCFIEQGIRVMEGKYPMLFNYKVGWV